LRQGSLWLCSLVAPLYGSVTRAAGDAAHCTLFIIPILFGTLAPNRWLGVYTLAATLFLLGSPNNVHIIPHIFTWNAVWIAAIALAASYVPLEPTGPPHLTQRSGTG